MQFDVYLGESKASVDQLTRPDDEALAFQYSQGPLPILMSLPLQKNALGQSDIAGLLFHLGQDCPGVLAVVAAGAALGKRPGDMEADYAPLLPDDRAVHDHQRLPTETTDPSPLAGVQGKLVLARWAPCCAQTWNWCTHKAYSASATGK